MKRRTWVALLGSVCLSVMTVFPAAAGTGWVQESDRWKYAAGDGDYIKNDWGFVDGQWYHFDGNGYMQTGWVRGEEGWYYFCLDGPLGFASEQVDSQNRSVQPVMGDGSYFVDGDSYIFNPDTDFDILFSAGGMNDTKVIAALKGVLDSSQLNGRERATFQKAKEFLDSRISLSDSNEQRAKKIFDYIHEISAYEDTGRSEDDCPYSVLVDGIGICGGIARTYKLLANGAGLDCRMVGNSSHAWNEVYTDGWKRIDVSTYDISADFYLNTRSYHCDGCGWSGVLPQRGYYTCPCGNTFGG